MTTEAHFSLRGRNPDVLTCIANLSNDEVFTPPDVANRMLDTLSQAWAANHGGADLWADKSVKFLDPCTKSGIFLREITRRLILGLEREIPDLAERVAHILREQVFGIAITQLTGMLARRSVYCSKHATGKHSVVSSFTTDTGNIWFQRINHTWNGDRCIYCGAARAVFSKKGTGETHAYAFIHTNNLAKFLKETFGKTMQFDVIIGNPPYQLTDSSDSASASPIYHKFIEQALALEPRFISMITPSRWFVGGKGLDDFRRRMLNESRLRELVDYVVDRDAFPNININGGVNYFLWDREHNGDCAITTVEKGGIASAPAKRALSEFDVFIRRNQAVSILRKVRSKNEPTFDAGVSILKPFGLRTFFFGAASESKTRNIKLHSSGKVTWVSRSEIPARAEWISKWKVLIGRATDGNEKFPLPIWDQRGPFIAGPGEACTETYLVAFVATSKQEARRVVEYMRTTFFRFLVSLRKITQDNKADVFGFVPSLAMDRTWTDDSLASRYNLSPDEVEFMGTMIRQMDFTG